VGSVSIFAGSVLRSAMAGIKEPHKVLPFIGLIFAPGFSSEIVKELNEGLGDVILKSDEVPFTHTTYYSKEMGLDLLRQWWAFGNLVLPDILAKLKLKTNEIEQRFLNDKGGRRVNIDPGLLSLSNLVLASTKNYAHRIYLGQGIYAEVTLLYKEHHFVPLEWTYPDYREDVALDFFNRARDVLRKRLVEENRALRE
jgi:hypothetical protein